MLSKEYNAKIVEKKWQEKWQEWKIFKFDPENKKPIFSIDTPPPYASAYHLHMGHAMHYSQFEFMGRFWRMKGANVFFPIGFDDNGLPTEKHVEEVYEIDKTKTTREEFKKLCLKETEKIEERFMKPMFMNLGFSCDWDIFYRTIDARCQRVAQLSFLDLYKKGYVYRGKEPTLWCPYHQTALAQAEVEDLERETLLNYIDFELEDKEKITIATTRPEFLPACVGIFVHPEDKRYKRLVGKRAIVPLFGQKVPIMTDEKVDREFGTGIVMICTFGDSTDVEWWRKHNLPLRICINEDGRLNEIAGEYKGLTIEQARGEITQDLKEQGLLGKQEKIAQIVGACWRCDTPVEFIVTEQWFIKTLEFKEQLIKQGKKINWHPSFYRKRYENWVENLGWDWCISRQRYYGVPMPIWYCEKCKEVIVAEEKDLPVNPEKDRAPVKKCPNCSNDKFIPELDVFDTWMTSSMTPQIASRWGEDNEFFKRIFPMSMRPQAHDIIRTWAFYTIFKAWLHHKAIPWRDVMMSGHGLDEHGRGMSKSRGNVVLPEDVIEKYSADAVRLWASSVALGDDLPYAEKDVVKGQRLLTKLWNASRFVSIHLEDYAPKKVSLEVMDRWILSKLNRIIQEGTKKFERYEYSKTKAMVELFFWHDFCDNYIELVKHRLYNPEIYGEDSKKAGQYTLYTVLLNSLKLLAPVIPHITEEVYQAIFKNSEKDISIHISKWPKVDEGYIDEDAERIGEFINSVFSRIRRYKAEKGLPLNHELGKATIHTTKKIGVDLEKGIETIRGAMRIKELIVETKAIRAEEKVIEIVPDFSKIGPEFRGGAKKVVDFLKMVDKDRFASKLASEGKYLASTEGKTIEILPRHIKEIKKETTSRGKKVEILDVPRYADVSIAIIKD